MNFGAERQFWSLRERDVLRRTGVLCATIALVAALAWLGGTTTPTAAGSAVFLGPAPPVVASASDTQARRCIRRLLDLGHNLTVGELTNRIADECFGGSAPVRRANPQPAVLSCLRAFGWQTAAGSDRVTGCLAD